MAVRLRDVSPSEDRHQRRLERRPARRRVHRQHPELFAVAVPEVGVLDMLRFHKFTIGWAWTSGFWRPDDPASTGGSAAYSPLHNLKPHQHYPATLVMTGDHR